MHDTWYSVYVEAQAPPGAQPIAGEDTADELMDLLAEHSGIVSAGDTSWAATVSVPASDVRSASDAGAVLVADMARKAGMPEWPLVRCEAVREDVLDAENARPTLPEIVSVPEAADILGVSQQRTRELAATQGDFPEPVYQLRTGKLWLRAAIEAYSARRPRKPGRRPQADQSAMETAFGSAVEATRWRAAAFVAGDTSLHEGLRNERLLQVYVVAEAPHSLYRSWSAWKTLMRQDLDPAAVAELSWTDADEDDLRQLLHGAPGHDGPGTAAGSDVAQSPESFGSFARSDKQPLISLLSEALDLSASESGELINLALIEAASRWDEAAISASPGEWVLGYAVKLHRTRRSELPEPPAFPSYRGAEPPALMDTPVAGTVVLTDTRVTGALALAVGVSPVTETSAGYPQVAPARPQTQLDADSVVMRLYTAHYRSLVRLAILLVRDVGTAEEVVQDSFVAMHSAAGGRRIDTDERALSYLRQSVVNRSRSVLRHRVVVDRNPPASSPGMPGTEHRAIALFERSAVIAALRTLPERQREALVLRFYADMSEAQIADAMEISRGAVKSHTARAMKALRKTLERQG